MSTAIEDELARLEALCARTDRGPWDAMYDWRVEDSTERPYALVFARVLDEDGTTVDIDIARCFRRQFAEWIVDAHTAMPKLLAVARAAQRASAEWWGRGGADEEMWELKEALAALGGA